MWPATQGFNVIFCNTDESESEQAEQLTALVQKRVDGVLLVPAASSAEAVAFLREQSVPVVVLDRRVPDCTVDSVRCDSEKGAYELVKLAAGSRPHRASPPCPVRGKSQRRWIVSPATGAPSPTVGWGLTLRSIAYGPFTQAGGFEMARQALALYPRPTAFLAANNFIAVGAYQARTRGRAERAGRHIDCRLR